MTKIIKLNDIKKQNIQNIHDALDDGQIIGYPTDTIYGLGIDIYNKNGINRLLKLKRREQDKPLSILYSDVNSLFMDFPNLSVFQQEFIKIFLPGKITVVLPVNNTKLSPVFIKDGFTGVRVIDYPKVNKIFSGYANPISTTSINPAGFSSAGNIQEILDYFPNQLSYIIDNGPSTNLIPSTVIKLLRDKFEIIREGSVSSEQIYSSLKTKIL